MSSARNAFLGIRGLPIWATGDGVRLDQGGGKGPRGNLRLGRSFSWINTKVAVIARQRNSQLLICLGTVLGAEGGSLI